MGVSRSMKRAFKYRFRPTDAQAAELLRTFGCVRKVYNLALAARTEAWTTRQKKVGYRETSVMLTGWKKTDDLAYLAEVSSVPLQEALRHLQNAFARFWGKSSKYPRFKVKRKSRASAQYTRSAFRYADGRLTLAKMAAPLEIVWSRPLPVVRAQRALSRKEKGSANHAKARTRVARVHGWIADRRRDHLHKLTTRLVRENQTLVIEDLTVRNMVKNHKLARAITDAAWGELRRMLQYKTAWYGRELIIVDRWFPSSKLCSVCGAIADQMPLNVREWTCESCGTTHDRDENAAINLLAAGLAVAACGADVRPQREYSSHSGRSVAKQEGPPARVGIPSPRGRGPGQKNLGSVKAPPASRYT
ncbi:RNA-guided endonuclease TnpB family protein [Streptomyces sp. NBC_01443]|uniref:RNA-guided endonuclease InsQ/TnpB family protein n=1 Tax=Streptomyces sp. NBC_01443 TaxID=2903868 RepID=UPI002257C732|nr:RNA-guided endonuclease TnpB family protein [Streptomyces sp. NBC_01443]MCX4627789.1 transposase [Streptomyces sp. NBC_01443]